MADNERKAEGKNETTDGFYTVHADMALNDIVSHQEPSAELARRMDKQLDQLVDAARSRRRTLLTSGQRRSFGLDDEYVSGAAEDFLSRIAELVAGHTSGLTHAEREELHALRAKAQQQALPEPSSPPRGDDITRETVSSQDERVTQPRWSKYSTKGSALRVKKVVELYEQLTVLEKRAFCDTLELSPKEVVDELEHMLTEAADALASIEDEAFVKQANDEFAGLEGDDLIAALMQKNQELSAQVEQLDVNERIGQDDTDSHHQSSTHPIDYVPQPDTTTTPPTEDDHAEDDHVTGDDSAVDGGGLGQSDVSDDNGGQSHSSDSARTKRGGPTHTVIIEAAPAERTDDVRGGRFQASPARVGKDDLAFAQTHLDATSEEEVEQGDDSTRAGQSGADESDSSITSTNEHVAENRADLADTATFVEVDESYDVDIDADDRDNAFDSEIVEDSGIYVDSAELLDEFPDDDDDSDDADDDDAEGFADLKAQEASEYFDEGNA